MKKHWKWLIVISASLNIIFILIFLMSGEEELNLSELTQQDLSKAVDVPIGITSKELLALMGSPIKRDADTTEEHWYYCKSGSMIDEFIQFTLTDHKLIQINNYTVSYTEIPGLRGNCELFIKRTPETATPNNASQRDAA